MNTYIAPRRAQLLHELHQYQRSAAWMVRNGFSDLRDQLEIARVRDQLLALEVEA